jgi:hypothetical protein
METGVKVAFAGGPALAGFASGVHAGNHERIRSGPPSSRLSRTRWVLTPLAGRSSTASRSF